MIHLYYGDGKGKTTAAIGLAVRHAGAGGNVLLVQFLKSGETGELKALSQIPEITVLRNEFAHGFAFKMTEAERARVTAAHNANLVQAAEALEQGTCTLLVLDEIAPACELALIDREAVDALIRRAKELGTELVLTGRNPSQQMMAAADYVTQMRCVRHPYQQGTAARKGVEY